MKPVLTKHNQHLFSIPTSVANETSLPAQRLGKRAGDYALERADNEHSPWYETPEEVEAGLEYGREKDEQLQRVAQVMVDLLNEDERVTMELRYKHGLTYRQIAEIMDRNASTIHRRIQRCIRKIQKRIRSEG